MCANHFVQKQTLIYISTKIMYTPYIHMYLHTHTYTCYLHINIHASFKKPQSISLILNIRQCTIVHLTCSIFTHICLFARWVWFWFWLVVVLVFCNRKFVNEYPFKYIQEKNKTHSFKPSCQLPKYVIPSIH